MPITGGKSTQREKVMHEGAEKQGTRSEDVASRLERHPVIKARITKLLDLVEKGHISAEVAWLRAENQSNFEALCSPAFLKAKELGQPVGAA